MCTSIGFHSTIFNNYFFLSSLQTKKKKRHYLCSYNKNFAFSIKFYLFNTSVTLTKCIKKKN